MEMGVDSVRVHDELMKLQRENRQLGALLAKANAKIEYTAGALRLICVCVVDRAHRFIYTWSS